MSVREKLESYVPLTAIDRAHLLAMLKARERQKEWADIGQYLWADLPSLVEAIVDDLRKDGDGDDLFSFPARPDEWESSRDNDYSFPSRPEENQRGGE